MKITLSHLKPNLELEILGEEKTIFVLSDEEAMAYNEAKIQLIEGCHYEYQFNDCNVQFKENTPNNKIVSFSKFGKNKGFLHPNIYVGTHFLEIENSAEFLPIEVRSIKSDYRSEYRFMLESITEKCTDLIMQIEAPIHQNFDTNFELDSQTLYQRFAFVKSLIESQEFEEAIQKIITNPNTKWQEENIEKDIRAIKKFNQKNIQQILTKDHRTPIFKNHFLFQNYGITSVPISIESTQKVESIDTPENRFVKYALEHFLSFCENCETKFEKYSRAKAEARNSISNLSNFLNHNFFKEISRPDFLKLNSPILQRKNGYREVLNAWLKFDLAAKLVWQGGDNVYLAGKKDIATLYEYWLFFTLLDLLKEIFEIEPKSLEELIHFDKEKLCLNLKQGNTIALKGIYKSPARNLNIQFSYNRSFSGKKEYPNPGSYTTTLRPDYTLSIWTQDIENPEEAELKELITHIHFDAKYKVDNFYKLIKDSSNEQVLNNEKEEEQKGNFKNIDLFKMHAYKDAIRRTAGAYILYPGEGKDEPFRGFHELIPGLGAFVMQPNKEGKNRAFLKQFILKIVDNFIDRASQRERTAVKIYEIHQHKKEDNDVLHEPIPEYLHGKKLIPDETFVLVGFSTNEKRFQWYEKNQKYVFRMDENKGALELEQNVLQAQYLLLRKSGSKTASDIYKITNKGIKVYSKTQLKKLGYPFSKKPKDYYLIIEIEKVTTEEFGNKKWNFKALEPYKKILQSEKNARIAAGIPFVVSLREMMKQLIIEN